jgi:hypothetical protein
MKNIIFYITISGSIFLIVLYALGVFFHIGYIKGMGFNSSFFPLGSWDNAIIWAYVATIHFIIDVSKILMHVNPGLTILISLIILSPLVKLYFWWLSKRKYIEARLHFWWLSRKERYPLIRRFFEAKIEKSLRAVEISNFFLVIVATIIIFALIIFALIPIKIIEYGKLVAIEQVKSFSESENKLCENSNEFWNQCITVSTSHLKEDNLPAKIEGLLVTKSETMLGILTKDGPITMSMPKYIYYKSIKNKHFLVLKEQEVLMKYPDCDGADIMGSEACPECEGNPDEISSTSHSVCGGK